MLLNRIKETCLYIQNLERTEAFYKDKLELPVIGKEEGRHIFFKAGSSVLLCFIAEATKNGNLPSHFGEGHMHLAFEVSREKYEEVREWIQSKDIKIEHEQHWHDNYYSFYFRDPDGHSLEVVPEGLWD